MVPAVASISKMPESKTTDSNVGGEQLSGGVNFGYSAGKSNTIRVSGASSGNSVGNISNTGVGSGNKVQAPDTAATADLKTSNSKSGGAQVSLGGNYGFSATEDNKITVSGWSKGNEVGNIKNTGVGTNNTATAPPDEAPAKGCLSWLCCCF